MRTRAWLKYLLSITETGWRQARELEGVYLLEPETTEAE